MMLIPLRGGDERDALINFRKRHCRWRPGAAKRCKKSYNRRARKFLREETKKELNS